MRVNTKIFAIITVALSCTRTTKEKYFDSNKHLVSLADRVKEVQYKEVIRPYNMQMIGSYLILGDYSGYSDRFLHIFDRETLKPITSALKFGKGPNEITRPGFFTVDETERIIYLNDHGKNVVWLIPLDSVICNPEYKPNKNYHRNPRKLLTEFYKLNDSIFLGIAMHPLSTSTFEIKTASWNLLSNTVGEFGYEHPKAQGRFLSTMSFFLSPENNLYVKAHYWVDLMTICNLDGTLRCNVYGSHWKKEKPGVNAYFYGGIGTFHSFLLAAYIGDASDVVDGNMREKGNTPSKILVFDSTGNYRVTLDVGYKFLKFLVDEKFNRIILTPEEDTENPIAYISINPKEL